MAEDLSSYIAKAIKESQQYRGLKLDPDTARQLMLLRYASSLPAPADPAKASELASLAAKLEGMYGKGKWCGEGFKEGVNLAEDKKNCRDLQQLSAVLEAAGQAKGPTPAAQLEAWVAWHKTTNEMRPLSGKTNAQWRPTRWTEWAITMPGSSSARVSAYSRSRRALACESACWGASSTLTITPASSSSRTPR